MTLLLSLAVICLAAFVFFQLGVWEERDRALQTAMRRADGERWNDLRAHCNATIAELERSTEMERALTAQIQADSAEMMREMEFYGEASQSCNSRGGNA